MRGSYYCRSKIMTQGLLLIIFVILRCNMLALLALSILLIICTILG